MEKMKKFINKLFKKVFIHDLHEMICCDWGKYTLTEDEVEYLLKLIDEKIKE